MSKRSFLFASFLCSMISITLCAGAKTSTPAPKQPDKPRPRLEVHYEKSQHRIAIVNREPGPYTFTFRFQPYENVRSSCGNPCTLSLYSGVHYIHLAKIDPLQRWRFKYRYRYRRGDYQAQIQRKHIYELPYARGANYKMGQAYNGSFTHKGDYRYALDFRLPLGTPIHAARAGKVIWTVDQFTDGGIEDRYKGRDNRVEVLHNDGTVARYGHMQRHGVKVKPGQQVKAGDLLGLSGTTGYSKGPHLHFHVYHPVNGERSVTIPTLFRTHRGLEILKTGNTYRRP